MLHIKEFFKKFSGITPPEKFIKDAVIQAVFKEVGEKIEPKNIKIQNSSGATSLFLSISPVIKSEIFMRKQEILQDLKESLGPKAPQDIW
ncbi:hypothetical protein L0Y69_00585 [bacterium]|nr:hypothetical protein [bacterium]